MLAHAGSQGAARHWGTQKRFVHSGRASAPRNSRTSTNALPRCASRAQWASCSGSLPATSCNREEILNSELSTSRRAFLAQTALLVPAIAAPGWAVADEADSADWSTFKDDTERFSIAVPPGWAYGEGGIPGNTSFSGASGTRRVIAWFPDADRVRDNAVTLVITNVGADFTAMGSFGTAYTFGANMVGGMDQSYLKRAPEWVRPKGPIQEAELLDAKEVGASYVVEYTIWKEPDPKRHLMSRVTLGFNGTYNRLYTLTAQTTEQEWPALKASVDKMLGSFRPPKRDGSFA